MKRNPLLHLFGTLFLLATLAGCAVYPTAPLPGPPLTYPPTVDIREPAYLYMMPSLGVYFIPEIAADIFYFSGKWYYRYGDRWHWAFRYQGPWAYVEASYLPKVIRTIPPGYRHDRRSRQYEKVPYGHWKRRIAEPPRSQFLTPPYLYWMPRYKVYYAPDPARELFLFKKRWYHRVDNLWYWGRDHRGPWNYLEIDKVPKNLRMMPHDYRQRQYEYKRKPYRDAKPERRDRRRDHKRH